MNIYDYITAILISLSILVNYVLIKGLLKNQIILKDQIFHLKETNDSLMKVKMGNITEISNQFSEQINHLNTLLDQIKQERDNMSNQYKEALKLIEELTEKTNDSSLNRDKLLELYYTKISVTPN
jgi:hypothetical protein